MLVDCDPSPEYHMHEFGVIQSYSASFNGEMGDTSKVTMMVVDDLLNPYHLLTNRIIDMDFPLSGERRLEHEIERLYNCRNIKEILGVTEDNIKEYEAFLERSMDSSRNEVTAVKNYIYQHYDEDLNLEMLAEKVYLSSGYLSFIFKKETGMNLNRYIRVFRMEKAKDLLCSTNMKVAQASEKVGFANVSYFCRSFRDYYGSSPESYRKGTAEDEQTS